MPAKTGASHGIAAFVTLLLGTVMSKFVWNAVPPLGELSLLTIETIRSLTDRHSKTASKAPAPIGS